MTSEKVLVSDLNRHVGSEMSDFGEVHGGFGIGQIIFFFFNWDSLHARLNSHYKAWSYKKKKHKKITAHRKSV